MNFEVELEKELNLHKVNTIPKHELIEREGHFETVGFEVYSRLAVNNIVTNMFEKTRVELIKKNEMIYAWGDCRAKDLLYFIKQMNKIINEVLGEK